MKTQTLFAIEVKPCLGVYYALNRDTRRIVSADTRDEAVLRMLRLVKFDLALEGIYLA